MHFIYGRAGTNFCCMKDSLFYHIFRVLGIEKFLLRHERVFNPAIPAYTNSLGVAGLLNGTIQMNFELKRKVLNLKKIRIFSILICGEAFKF